MNVAQLRELLENYADDAEVIIGVQPSYPLIHALHGVIGDGDHIVDDEEHDEECASYSTGTCDCAAKEQAGKLKETLKNTVVLLTQDGHPYDRNPYGTKAWWDNANT